MKILTTTRSLLILPRINYKTIEREIELANKAIKRADKYIEKVKSDDTI